ncbi:site-specific DNA-methyltransferase [Salinispora arenicola]|nr:DNA methyltransferase [Salinispora arenicola]NIL64718.1 site-specific DNA-methyltransferase [Salinispora arenicola]
MTAEDAGLTYVNSIAVARRFGLYSRRRFVHQHHRVTLLCKGSLTEPARVFHLPPEMPRGRTGQIYATDLWTDIPEQRRRNLLRYDNSLHPALVSRVIRATTDLDHLVADPFLGSGTTAIAALQDGRTLLRRGPERGELALHHGTHPCRGRARHPARNRAAHALRRAGRSPPA